MRDKYGHKGADEFDDVQIGATRGSLAAGGDRIEPVTSNRYRFELALNTLRYANGYMLYFLI